MKTQLKEFSMSHDIKKDGKILARYIKASEAWGHDNLSFFSQDEEYIQAGSWNYNKGKKLLAHTHNELSLIHI